MYSDITLQDRPRPVNEVLFRGSLHTHTTSGWLQISRRQLGNYPIQAKGSDQSSVFLLLQIIILLRYHCI